MRCARGLSLLLGFFCCAASGFERKDSVELFIVCKEVRTRKCYAKHITTRDDMELTIEIKSLPSTIKAVCGISDMIPVSQHRRFIKVVSPMRKHPTFCKISNVFVEHQLPWYLERNREKRDVYTPRGRYRGQTQSQYLSIDGGSGGDDGKAEAHSSADVSRAIVSGKSGMGQAQSQTTYDSSCDDCYGRGEPGSEYLYREYLPYIPQIQGRTPGGGISAVNYGSERPGAQKPGGTFYPYNPNSQGGDRIPESDSSNYGKQRPSHPQESDSTGATGNGNYGQIPSSGIGNGGYNTNLEPGTTGNDPNNYSPSGTNIGGTMIHTQSPTKQGASNGYVPTNGSGTGNYGVKRPGIVENSSNGYGLSGRPVTGDFGTQKPNGNGLRPNGYGSQGITGGGTGPYDYGSQGPHTGSYDGQSYQIPVRETKFDTYKPSGTGHYDTPISTTDGTRPNGSGLSPGMPGGQENNGGGTGLGIPETKPSGFGTQTPNGGGAGYGGNVMIPGGFGTQAPSGNGLGNSGNGLRPSGLGTQGPIERPNVGTINYIPPSTSEGGSRPLPHDVTGGNIGVSGPATSYQEPGTSISQTPYNPQFPGSPVALPQSGQWPFIGPYTWNQHGQTYFCCVVGPNGIGVPTLGDPRLNGIGYNQRPLNVPSHGANNANGMNNGMYMPNMVNNPINGETSEPQIYDRRQGYIPGPNPTNYNPIYPAVQSSIPMSTNNKFPSLNIPNLPNGGTANWNNGQNSNSEPNRFPGSTNTQNSSGGNYDPNNQNPNSGQNNLPQTNIPNTQNSQHGTWPTDNQNTNNGQNIYPGPNVMNVPRNPNTQNSPWNGQNQNGMQKYPTTSIPISQNESNRPWNTNIYGTNGDQNGKNFEQNFPNIPNSNVPNAPENRMPNYNWNMPDGHTNSNKPTDIYTNAQTEPNLGSRPSYNTGQRTTNGGPFNGDGAQMINRGPGVNRNEGPENGGINYGDNQGRQTNWMAGQNGEHGAPPLNFMDPNSISTALDNGDSQASASVDQGPNGTLAQASSDGGIGKGRAKTSVEGQYTGSGTFSAQAQISDESKNAESEVSGGKHGALSTALGRGGKSKSEASVQLGSETGSISTNAHSDGSLHSSLTQVQGSVKGGMADAQARGPGSTSSQAQIGFTPYKEGDESHKNQKTPFAGGGKSLAQSNGRIGQSESQLHGTFKYGITYTGGAQAGSSVDKEAVFTKRLPFNEIDVFDENEKNIDVESEITTEQTSTTESSLTTEVNTYDETKNVVGNQSVHTHSDHHKTETIQPASERRSFEGAHDDSVEYEDTTIKEETVPEDYDHDAGFGGEDPEVQVGENEYPNYEDYARESDSTHQSLQSPIKSTSNIEVKQTTGGNTQHILLGPLRKQNAEITQRNSEQKPDESKVYQPGERVPGTGGYTIPIGFTGSVKSVASKHQTYAIGSKDSPSQAQTVAITPGAGRIKYNNYPTARSTYTRNVHPKDLRSLYSPKQEDNRYLSVSKSVTGALDGDNNIKKQYSHTYYTKSSSCGYFTFTCTIVSGTNGRTKICKPKIPLNSDGTPMKC